MTAGLPLEQQTATTSMILREESPMPSALVKGLPVVMKKTRASMIVLSVKNGMTTTAIGTETAVAVTEIDRGRRIANEIEEKIANALGATAHCRQMKVTFHIVTRADLNAAIAMDMTLPRKKDLQKEARLPRPKIRIH